MSYTGSMKLIVGLGNPDAHYSGTRHNVGYWVLDKYAARHDTLFQPKPRFKALIADIARGTHRAILTKPTTYYNLSGESVRTIADYYKIAAHDILIIHDDIALPCGTLRTRRGGSDAGNNGVKSVSQHMGEATARLRIGTHAALREQIDDADFVLGAFTREESALLDKQLAMIFAVIDSFIEGRFDETTHGRRS